MTALEFCGMPPLAGALERYSDVLGLAHNDLRDQRIEKLLKTSPICLV